ncbi:MAG: hypothetical protein JSU57_00705 [Candidatus Heimdallarchaeota archaeon]|nr:MAG: hypothetical protein JSU57_00705 [Candidatus Heimdallarchaeota archaeon]
MDPLQWYNITKEALILAESELDTSQFELMLLIQLDAENQTILTSKSQPDAETAALFGQAWNSLTNILTNELHLEARNSLTIKSHNKILTIYSLGFDVLLVILSEAAVDSMDVLKIILRFVFQIGYKKKYEIVGLVSSEGYPVWLNSVEEMDDFLFAISITSLLSLVERIDYEVSAGGIGACILQGTENLLLNVAFNPSQDLALAVTQQGTDLDAVTLDPELKTLYQKIVDPVVFSAIVPEIIDEDRERMLEEIRQAFEGETTEEEIQTLNVFDTEMLKSLENEIKTVSKKYGANEISIGYLRKRMRLPAEVLSMALQYLIGEGSIVGRIGTARQSGREILVLDFSADISGEDKQNVKIVQDQINELFEPLNPYLSQLPEIKPLEPDVQEAISEALGEFQIMLTLADTDPLYLLANDLRILGVQLASSVKTLTLLKQQLSETDQDDVLRNELERRHTNLDEKILEQRLTINGKVNKFYEDLFNFYRLLFRLLPPPIKFTRSRSKRKATVTFKCPAHDCSTTVRIRDGPSSWVKLSVFAVHLGIQKDFPEKVPSRVNKIKKSLENKINKLTILAQKTDTRITLVIEDYLFIENLDELLITNTQRDNAINILRRSRVPQSTDKVDFYSLFEQCSSCNRWYCKTHMSTATKCIYC